MEGKLTFIEGSFFTSYAGDDIPFQYLKASSEKCISQKENFNEYSQENHLFYFARLSLRIILTQTKHKFYIKYDMEK